MIAATITKSFLVLFGIIAGALWGIIPFILACLAYHYTDRIAKNGAVSWACAISTLTLCAYLNVLYFY